MKSGEINILLKEKKYHQKQIKGIDRRLKNIRHGEMLGIEKERGLTLGCNITLSTKEDYPPNSASLLYLKYVGIEDPYSFGYHAVKILYRLQGCEEHSFFHSDIEDINKDKL